MDADAFERLFDQTFDDLYGYLARRVGPDIGRDVAAETFARAFAGRRRYDRRRGDARAWLFGIAHNLLGRHYRDEKRRLRALARVERPRDGAWTDERLGEEPRLAVALAALAAEERDVLRLHAWADLSYDQIGQALGVPVGTVRSRLNRARRRLREALTQEEALDG